MAVNNDVRIKLLWQAYKRLNKLEHWRRQLSTHIMSSKLKPIFSVGERVQITIRDVTYVGTVIENRKIIYTTGENGFLQVRVKWDNPAENWHDGVFGFNQIHLTRAT